MMDIINKVDKKIKKIRRSDQRTKRNWLIVSTVIMMLLVISLWAWYMNFNIRHTSDSNNEVVESNNMSQDKTSIISIFVRGYNVIKGLIVDKFNETIKWLKPLISKTKESFNNVKEYTPSSTSSLPFNAQN